MDFLAFSSTPASVTACSLCCQQKKAAAPSELSHVVSNASTPSLDDRLTFGDDWALVPRARLHGRPLDVMPLHVVAAFFESDRGMRDSGV